MKRYLIIQSQDPFSHSAAEQHYALACDLRRTGNTVRMLLVQHGVGIAHHSTDNSAFEQLLKADVDVYADRYALAERQINSEELRPEITVCDLDVVANALLDGDKVIWH